MRFHAFSKRHLLAVLLLCSLGMSFAGSRVPRPLRDATRFALAPLGAAPMYAATKLVARLNAESTPDLSKHDVQQVIEENEFLRRQSNGWQARSEYFERQEQQLKNFTKMYGQATNLGCELISARVVGAGSLPYDRTRVLGSGSRQGIKAGDMATARDLLTDRTKALPPKLAVVNESSLVGRVVDSGPFTARLQLVTDRDFQIVGAIRRVIVSEQSRMVTLTEGMPQTTQLNWSNNKPITGVYATGNGADMVVVPDVKAYHNVLPGDQLWASAEKEFLPVDIYIGKVEKVEPDAKDAHRVKVYVRPHFDVANVRDVFIISPLTTQAPKP